jgi:AcrR family transcriptional regulator
MITDTAALLIEERRQEFRLASGDRQTLGCAHTNLYNYYGSLTEILWDVAAWILKRMMHDTRGEHLSADASKDVSEEDLLGIFLAFFDFSVDHPGWYRFLWLEKQEGTPTPEAAKVLSEAMGSIYGTLGKLAGGVFSPDKVQQYSDILFCYTYGEITSWLTTADSMRAGRDEGAPDRES